MRALLRKELVPFLAPALVGALLFTALYVAAFDVEKTLLAPPANALPVVLFAALCCGTLLGYGQLAVERHGDTLSYLLHRDQPLARVLAAKCLAGWVLLAIVVHLPLVLFALWERSISPLGPVLQWTRLGELLLLGLACVPAHSLGLLCATSRLAPGWRVVLLTLMTAGLGFLIVIFLANPIAGPSASRALYGLAMLLLAAGLLLRVNGAVFPMGDAERALPPRGLVSTSLIAVLLIGFPAAAGLTLLQGTAFRSLPTRGPHLLWRSDVGLVRAIRERGQLQVKRTNGKPLDLSELNPPRSSQDGVTLHDLWKAGFETIWPMGRLSRAHLQSAPFLSFSISRTSSIAPVWKTLGSIDFRLPGSDETLGGARAFLDSTQGCVMVLHAARWPRPTTVRPQRHTSAFLDAPRPTLRALVRGDGRLFSASSHSSSMAGEDRLEVHGVPVAFGEETLFLEDYTDGTVWSLDLGDPRSVPVQVQVGGRAVVQASPRIEAPEPARIFAAVEGDRMAFTVRALDRGTGEVLHEERMGALAEGTGRLAATILLASNLLHPPAAVLAAHLALDDVSWSEYELLAGVVTGRRRRPLLVAVGFALSCALAWLADRRLARRGAERWRRFAWGTALVLLGPLAWLAFITLEPRPPRTAIVRAAPRRLLLASEEGSPA